MANTRVFSFEDYTFESCRISSGVTTCYNIIHDVTGVEAVTSCPSGTRLAIVDNDSEFEFLLSLIDGEYV